MLPLTVPKESPLVYLLYVLLNKLHCLHASEVCINLGMSFPCAVAQPVYIRAQLRFAFESSAVRDCREMVIPPSYLRMTLNNVCAHGCAYGCVAAHGRRHPHRAQNKWYTIKRRMESVIASHPLSVTVPWTATKEASWRSSSVK